MGVDIAGSALEPGFASRPILKEFGMCIDRAAHVQLMAASHHEQGKDSIFHFGSPSR
jgi:hypothetical protein